MRLVVEALRRLGATALFALPTADGGWTDLTAADFQKQVIALAKGFVAAGIALTLRQL